MKKNAGLVAFLVVMGLGFAGHAPCFGQATKKSPNILLLLADDWSAPHASILGDKVIKTPTFDWLARNGALFLNAYVNSPSCTPSRASILTGKEIHRLQQGAQLWGFLPTIFETYPDALEKSGYFVGYQGKGWGPGSIEAAGRTRNPSGNAFTNFNTFLRQRPKDKPFCFWFGSRDPHRPYDLGSGRKAGMDITKVQVPGFLPDDSTVRSDILDYYFEVERFDRDCQAILKTLDSLGLLENTLVVMTSDNGMPFPRAKANLYDGGTKVPLAVYWKGKIKPARLEQFVTLRELAPTFLTAAGLRPVKETGAGLLPLLLTGKDTANRSAAFLERERHANVRQGDLSYPARAVRTKDFLYIINLRPGRYPAGDPKFYFSVGPYGDIDASPTKEYLIKKQDSLPAALYFSLATAKRPPEELYDLKNDPDQLHNVTDDAVYQTARQQLRQRLLGWMQRTGDPRATGDSDVWDTYPYFGKKVE